MTHRVRGLAVGISLFVAALALMWGSIPRGISREAIVVAGPGGMPSHGTVWRPETPKGVIVIGHGVTSNGSVMATMAKAFARNGYIAITFDFWGHGRSREEFSWRATPEQVAAWCAWARRQYTGLPLAYLGHSMGGFAGSEAFVEPGRVDAFVTMGMLPRETPVVKTLIAMGAFEELFSPDEARNRFEGNADIVVSPWSDHTLEPWDPVLVERITAWLDSALGLNHGPGFPWLRWLMQWAAVVVGCAAAFVLGEQAAAALRRQAAPEPGAAVAGARHWSLNPYRIAGWLLGYRGRGLAPRGQSAARALAQGALFFVAFIVPLSFVLTGHVFTCRIEHPLRWLLWCVVAAVAAIPVAVDIWLLERLPLTHARGRFAVAALTRAVPLLALAAAVCLAAPQMAFGAMMLAIYTFIFVMLAAVHALATRGSGDYRAGAAASLFLFAWVIAFWFPLPW